MASEEDFYGVLGLKKECTPTELRLAYKKLAMKWHPDRFSASGNPKYVEEAKKKFQTIQQAYSVLSDTNKRFLYDVGVYDSNDEEDNNGMGDFLDEMVTMMTQTKSKLLQRIQILIDREPTNVIYPPFVTRIWTQVYMSTVYVARHICKENGGETFEELQEMFNEVFHSDVEGFDSSSRSATPKTCSSSSSISCNEAYNMSKGKSDNYKDENSHFEGFCFGSGGSSSKYHSGESSRRKNTKKGRR